MGFINKSISSKYFWNIPVNACLKLESKSFKYMEGEVAEWAIPVKAAFHHIRFNHLAFHSSSVLISRLERQNYPRRLEQLFHWKE